MTSRIIPALAWTAVAAAFYLNLYAPMRFETGIGEWTIAEFIPAIPWIALGWFIGRIVR